jgi:hypothetical protein
MYCTQCGTLNNQTALACSNCGLALVQFPERIPNYLVQAILVTVCCCVPFGIPAIVFAAQVNSKLAAGDLAGALDSSRKAKMWSWIAFGLGFTGALAYFGLIMFGVIADMR